MSEEPERRSSPPAAEDAAPAPAEAPAPPLVPMRAMRVISVGLDSVSAPYSPGPDSGNVDSSNSGATSEPVPAPLTVAEDIAVPTVEPLQAQADTAETPTIAIEAEDFTEDDLEEEETTPALSEDDLEDSHSEEPPEVVESAALPLVTRTSRPPRPEIRIQEAEAPLPPTSVERKAPSPPSPPQRSAKPALPSAKPRRKPWWEEVFGDDFSRAHKALSEGQILKEAAFVERTLELAPGSVILDLCCGQGQLAIELSRRGFPVVGYDLSVFQLAVAADYAQAARQKINFLQGDMREMAFDSMFEALVCWDTSFGYFEEEKNLDVARRMFQALKPGGSLLLDIMNRDYAAREAPSNHWFEGDGCICMDDMSLDWITSRLKVKRSVILDDGRSKELTYSIRVYNLSEIGKILHDVGFRVLSVSGHPSTPGAFLGSRSPRIIIRAQRPA